jgi:hypothetical protein
MIKKTIYPKTQRTTGLNKIIITEKIDGSNLTFFKYKDELYFAQRNFIFKLSELEEIKQKVYKGLYGWLTEHGKDLEERLNNNSVICGEWIGMGRIKYGQAFDGIKFLMFAKANVNEKFDLFNINYYQEFFIYPFVDGNIPDYIGKVPVVFIVTKQPEIQDLNERYDFYTNLVNRKVEGFIVNSGNSVSKYVRLKDGKLAEHHA